MSKWCFGGVELRPSWLMFSGVMSYWGFDQWGFVHLDIEGTAGVQ